MNGYGICVDTNIWIDSIERNIKEVNRSKRLIQLLTDVESPHKIIIPKIIYLEIIHKLIDIKKDNYMITHNGYSSSDLKLNEIKILKFNTALPENEMKKIENIIRDFETSDKIEITSSSIDFSKVEFLIKQGFDLFDSMIIVQTNEYSDYFTTRDTIARKVNDIESNWIKIKAISLKGMLSLLERYDKK